MTPWSGSLSLPPPDRKIRSRRDAHDVFLRADCRFFFMPIDSAVLHPDVRCRHILRQGFANIEPTAIVS